MNVFDKKIVITGCVKNVEKDLPQSLHNIIQISKLFKQSHFIFAENDSSDGTVSILNKFKQDYTNTTLFLFENLDERISLRTHRLAFLRNKILSEIHSNHQDADYFIVADLDSVMRYIDLNQFRKCFDYSWDMLAASSAPYYDIWALRTNKYTHCFPELTTDCWLEYRKGLRRYQKHWLNQLYLYLFRSKIEKDLINYWIHRYEITLDTSQLISVDSAFNGIAIYKLKKTLGCFYNGTLDLDLQVDTQETCEHVSFHKSMIEKHDAKLFINPNFKLLNQN